MCKFTLSVVICAYNTKEEYLREAIESILNQTYKDFEFLIINDGSTNNVEEVVKSYSDDRIRYIYQENKGVAAARNLSLREAQGKYIAVMDSDDISLPTRLEKQLKFLEENPEYSVVGNSFKVFPRNEVKIFPKKPKMLDFLMVCSTVHGSIMFRKDDFVKNNLFYDETLKCAVDYDLFCRSLPLLQYYNLEEVLYLYRVEGQGIATINRDDRVKNTIKIQKKLLERITESAEEQKLIIDTIYKKNRVNKKFYEHIFSIKNFLKYNKKYKVITILGLEIWILSKKYEI